jgi:hypothetical protein
MPRSENHQHRWPWYLTDLNCLLLESVAERLNLGSFARNLTPRALSLGINSSDRMGTAYSSRIWAVAADCDTEDAAPCAGTAGRFDDFEGDADSTCGNFVPISVIARSTATRARY